MDTLTTPNWKCPANLPSLQSDEIHVWQASLHKLDCQGSWLSEDEHDRWQGMQNQVVARRFCAVRTLLRRLLGNYADLAPSKIELQAGEHGKPALVQPPIRPAPQSLTQQDNSLQFNLSHCGDKLLLAFARGPAVGIDVEQVRQIPNQEGIARRVLGLQAFAILEADGFKPESFCRLWTRMEARQKCVGRGVFGDPVDESSLDLRTFKLDSSWIFSLAAERAKQLPTLRFFQSG